jgi:hypothetical protein
VQRDINFMRDELHLPLAYDEQRHGYFYEKPVGDRLGRGRPVGAELGAVGRGAGAGDAQRPSAAGGGGSGRAFG